MGFLQLYTVLMGDISVCCVATSRLGYNRTRRASADSASGDCDGAKSEIACALKQRHVSLSPHRLLSGEILYAMLR